MTKIAILSTWENARIKTVWTQIANKKIVMIKNVWDKNVMKLVIQLIKEKVYNNVT